MICHSKMLLEDLKKWRLAKKLFVALGFLVVFLFTQAVLYQIGSTTRYFPVNDISVATSFGDGSLGNQMSAFSSLFAFERDYGVRVFMMKDQLHKLEPYFNSSLIKSTMRTFETYFPDWSSYEWLNLFSDKSLNDSFHWRANSRGVLIDVGKYPNAIYTYYKYINELRNIFKIRQSYISQAEAILEGLKNNGVALVSVHIRRKDYGAHLKTLYNMTYVSESYFHKAIKFFQTFHKDGLFYIVSDEPEWAKQHLENKAKNIIVIESGEHLDNIERKGIDFALLSLANASILSYGTFGMWGALLAGGQAVLPMSHVDTKEAKEVIEANIPGWIFI